MKVLPSLRGLAKSLWPSPHPCSQICLLLPQCSHSAMDTAPAQSTHATRCHSSLGTSCLILFPSQGNQAGVLQVRMKVGKHHLKEWKASSCRKARHAHIHAGPSAEVRERTKSGCADLNWNQRHHT